MTDAIYHVANEIQQTCGIGNVRLKAGFLPNAEWFSDLLAQCMCHPGMPALPIR